MNFTPADYRTVGRVDLFDFNALTVAAGDEVRLDLPIAETRQHPAITTGLPSKAAFFCRKSSFSMTMGLPTSRAYCTTLATASPINASAW